MPCENATQTDPWKLVTLIPSKGANKNKYRKRPRPDAKKRSNTATERQNENRSLQDGECEVEVEDAIPEPLVNETGLDHSDGEVDNDEITFEIQADVEDNCEQTETEKSISTFTENAKILRKHKNQVTDCVTDAVTDQLQDLVVDPPACSWVNLCEEIHEQDFISTSESLPDLPESSDLQVIDVCSRRSKEFELASENIVQTNKFDWPVTDIFKNNLPYRVTWSCILTALHNCQDFGALEALCKDFETEMPRLGERVQASFSKEKDTIDYVAQREIPHDGPRGLNAIITDRDGNCLCHAVSRGYFDTDEKHLEIRARIVIEGVLNKKSYLSDDCLERGASYLHRNADLLTVFTTFSEYYTPGQKVTDDSIDCIYCMEIHSVAKEGTYMGLWQLAQLASVLKVPVHTIYPVCGESTIRNDFNRMFFPVSYTDVQDEEPLVIMWTGIRHGSAPIHFVPLLPSDDQ